RPSSSGTTFAVEDPATTKVITEVADASSEDAAAAMDAVARAFPEWGAVAPRERAEALRAVFDRMTARADELAAVVTAEGGKPLAEARAEVAYGAEYVRWYSEQAVRVDGLARRAPAGTNHQVVMHRPVGPAFAITPWNFPIAMATR